MLQGTRKKIVELSVWRSTIRSIPNGHECIYPGRMPLSSKPSKDNVPNSLVWSYLQDFLTKHFYEDI